jgi:hypothetical protein
MARVGRQSREPQYNSGAVIDLNPNMIEQPAPAKALSDLNGISAGVEGHAVIV